MPTDREMTFGEKAVGLTFNPSGDDEVARIKKDFAAVIDRLHDLRVSAANCDVEHMLSISITEAQTAQMWAVKAVTWKS
jgi:hypothetical protein